MITETQNLPIGQQVSLPGHFDVRVTLEAARPLAKGLIKGYLAVADRMKEVMAEAGEQLSDLVAEARAEYTAGAAVSAATTEQRISTPSET